MGRFILQVEIYTDGACYGNPGLGGWGAVLKYGSIEKEIYGGELNTTNNRMEITAAIKALKALKKNAEVILITDSQYLRMGITQWINGWKKNNWRTAAGQAVKNKELWLELDQIAQKHSVQWQWVKGHAGDPMNERADELAKKGAQEAGAS